MALDEDSRVQRGQGRHNPWRRRRRIETVVAAPLVAASAAVLVVAGMLGQRAEEAPEETAAPSRTLGVAGTLPRQGRIDPRLLEDAAELRAPGGDPRAGDPGAAAPEPASPARAEPAGRLDVPESVLRAYRSSARAVSAEHPGCGLHWSVLAALGRVESGHARGGAVDAVGTTTAPILGPVLDGEGVAAVPDTDGGRLDGDARWDRAVGPMQFIPQTWRAVAEPGMDPNNLHDATTAAGEYLCSGGRDLSRPQELARAVFGYNRSAEYVREVLVWAGAYERGEPPSPGALEPPDTGDSDVTPYFPRIEPVPPAGPVPAPRFTPEPGSATAPQPPPGSATAPQPPPGSATAPQSPPGRPEAAEPAPAQPPAEEGRPPEPAPRPEGSARPSEADAPEEPPEPDAQQPGSQQGWGPAVQEFVPDGVPLPPARSARGGA